jgi:hypothetical protein
MGSVFVVDADDLHPLKQAIKRPVSNPALFFRVRRREGIRPRGDGVDLEQELRTHQGRHDQQHRGRSRIAEDARADLRVSRDIGGAHRMVRDLD